jgi:serine/threonine protein kinase/WD40 repeat protein
VSSRGDGLDRQRWIDQICDSFESAWKSGTPPDLEQLLAEVPPESADALLRELLPLEFHYRRNDPAFNPYDYLQQFPRHGALIRGLTDELSDTRSERPTLSLKIGDTARMQVDESVTMSPELSEAQIIGDYQIVSEIARGGMGIVYRARQRKLDRDVALKIMLPAGPGAAERFRQEAEAAAGLTHTNIVPVLDIGRHGGLPYLTMPLVEGPSLGARMKAGPIAPHEAAEWIRQVADALQSAHDRGVIHRDIKPENILLEDGRTPKVTDFGLAKQLNAASGLTQTRQILGTPDFMAPEQFDAPQRIDCRSDVYSLGTVLYALLVGHPPFEDESLGQLIQKIQHSDPKPPRSLRPGIPRDLDTICLECLQKSPDRRYSSAAALAADLRRFLAGEPVLARPMGHVEQLSRWAHRRPWITATVVFGLAVSVLLAIGLLLLSNIQNRLAYERELSRLQEEAAEREVAAAQQLADTQRYYSLLTDAEHRSAMRPSGWTWRVERLVQQAVDLNPAPSDRPTLRTLAVNALSEPDVRLASTWEPGFEPAAVAYSPVAETPRPMVVAALKAAAFTVCHIHQVDLHDQNDHKLLTYLPDFQFQASAKADGVVQDGARTMAYSADGRLLAVGTRSGWIHQWDLTRSEGGLQSWRAHQAALSTLAYTDGDAKLVSHSRDEEIKVWQSADGSQVTAFGSDHGSIEQAAVSSRTGIIACSCRGEGTLLIGIDGTKLGRLPIKCEPLDFSPDGRFLLAVPWPETRISIIDVDAWRRGEPRYCRELLDHRLRPEWASHSKSIEQAAFSPDGRLIASVARDGVLRLWEASTARLIAQQHVGETSQHRLCFCRRGRYLLACTQKGVNVFEIARAEDRVSDTLATHAEPVADFAWLGRDRLVCLTEHYPPSGPIDGNGPIPGMALTFWQREGEGTWSYTGNRHEAPPETRIDAARDFVATSPDLQWVATPQSYESAVIFESARSEAQGQSLPLPQAELVRFGPDGRLWAVSENHRVTCRAWPENTIELDIWIGGASLHDGFTGLARPLDLAISEHWAFVACRSGRLHIIDIAKGEIKASVPLSDRPITALALSPDGTQVVTGDDSGTVRVMDWHVMPTSRVPVVIRELTQLDHSVTTLDFSDDGRLLAIGDESSIVSLWRKGHDDKLEDWLKLNCPSGPPRRVRFAPSGRSLFVLVSGEAGLRRWRIDQLEAALNQFGLD